MDVPRTHKRRGRPKKATPDKNLKKTQTQKLRRSQIRAALLDLKREHARGFDAGKSLVDLEPLRKEIKRLSSALNNVRGHEWFARTPKVVREQRELASIPESPNHQALQHGHQIPQSSSSHQHALSPEENRTVSS